MNKNLYFYKFRVTRIVDGDTVYGITDLGCRIKMDMKVRLYGINTPEIRGGERSAGLIAKQQVEALLPINKEGSRQVYIETHLDKTGKYGRWLGTLWVEGMDTSVNDWLVTNNYAKRRLY